MDAKDAYIQHLENTIKDLTNQVNNLTELLLLMRKEKFGSKSEQTPKQVDGQISLFNEAEVEADASVKEPITISVKTHLRKQDKTGREELLKDLPVREFPCCFDKEDMFCDQCGSALKEIGYTKEILKIMGIKEKVLFGGIQEKNV